MAGENILPNEHYPDYFQIVSIPFNHALEGTAANTMPFMYVEPRATNGTGIVVDSIVVGISLAEGLGSYSERGEGYVQELRVLINNNILIFW